MNEDILKLMHMTSDYYETLIKQGIPEKLAVRIVGDWYNGVVTLAVNHFHRQYTKSAGALSHRMARTDTEH